MKPKHFSQSRKDFYKNFKKSLQNQYSWVIGSKNRTIDILVFDIRKDVQLFKIISPSENDNVKIWVEKLKSIYVLSWYKASYTLVYVDENFIEQKRETFILN